MYAIRHDNYKEVEYILTHGGDANARFYEPKNQNNIFAWIKCIINTPYAKYTALNYTIRMHDKITSDYESYGGPTRDSSAVYPWTASQYKIVKSLLVHGADPNARSSDGDDCLLALAKSQYESVEIAKLLLKSGVLAHAQEGNYLKAIDYTRQTHKYKLLNILINNYIYVHK